ncbi:MAG: METTL5 family protein [Candidatus Bathyarchaeia archaeon]|nr:METTL5 family protein [Candidatus Bathyarchaeia archaeon]
MQKRLVRKLDLELFLSQIESPPTPKPSLEQYTIPAGVAATILYLAAYAYNDIINKTVLDLGCGAGRLALGAAFLGAKHVVGVDIDKSAVRMAFENSLKANMKGKVEWIIGDVDVIHGKFDTVLQNPPFGVQKPKADRKFLKKALETGKVVYSLHKSPHKDKAFVKRLKARKNGVMLIGPSSFFKRFIEAHGGKIRAVYATVMAIPHMFSFHTKKKHEFVAELYVIERI